MRMLKTRLVPVVVLLMLLTSTLPAVEFEALEDAPEIKQTPANLETYNLYPVSYTHLTLPTNREV